MTEATRWVAVNVNDTDTYFVAFDPDCRTACGSECRDRRHGHVRLCTDEGLMARIPFPCSSQEGVRKVLEHELERGRVGQPEVDAVLALDEVRQLPPALQPHEAEILEVSRRMTRMTHYAYHSHI